jgi:hypothetical protein
MYRRAVLLLVGVLLVACATAWGLGKRESKAAAVSTIADCLVCHSSTSPKYPLLGARMGYDVSGHKIMGDAAYANGTGCQVCHTNEGFIDFASGKKIDPNAWVVYPSQPGCFTCHAPHETGTMQLRTATPVTLKTGAVFDVGNGNLCANCHQARDTAANLVVPTAANKVGARWGIHHGPQADMVSGTNGFQFPGKVYGSSAHKDVIKDGCVDCHMSLPSGRSGFTAEPGGHSFKIAGQVHGSLVLNTSGCISCHKDIAQVPGRDVFNVIAQEDYDLDGKKDPTMDEVQGLMNRLVNTKGTGLLQKLPIPLYTPDGTFTTSVSPVVRSVVEMGALYNFQFVQSDKSRGIHNTKYTIQLLMDSIQALDPSFDVSRRPK